MGRHAHSVEKPKDLVISTNQSAGAAHGNKHQLITSKANAAPVNNGSTTTTTTTSGMPQVPSNNSSQC